jgi:hypothetical protein
VSFAGISPPSDCKLFRLPSERYWTNSALTRTKEGEAFEYGPVADGCHLYGGWFYFVGELVTAGERNCNAPDSHHFDYFCTRSHPRAQAFQGGPVLAIEFTTHLKWVLAEDPDSGRHPAKSRD